MVPAQSRTAVTAVPLPPRLLSPFLLCALCLRQLLSCADLTMAYGRRYGLVGRNGIGKTTLLKMISSGQLRIPSGISLLAVEQEVEGDDTRVLDAVLASDSRRQAMIDKEHVLQARLNK
ncbi:hypothetical protein COOONC_24991 [Cooperia oncophora]